MIRSIIKYGRFIPGIAMYFVFMGLLFFAWSSNGDFWGALITIIAFGIVTIPVWGGVTCACADVIGEASVAAGLIRYGFPMMIMSEG